MSKTEEELKAASFQTTGTSAMRRGLSRRPLGTAQGRRVGAGKIIRSRWIFLFKRTPDCCSIEQQS